MSKEMPSEEENWSELIYTLKNDPGIVVPILGRDLLKVKTAGSYGRLFHELIAENLAKELKIDKSKLPPGFDAAEVINHAPDRAMDFTGKIQKIVNRLCGSVDEPGSFAMPEVLIKLAKFEAFKLFISTTFDPYLERAISNVHSRPAVLSFPAISTGAATDFKEELLEKDGRVVYQLLGRAVTGGMMAVTEGEVLEKMHLFMASGQSPRGLIEKLQRSHLLFIGVSFPDWLARFFLRLVRKDNLSNPQSYMQFVAGSGPAHEDFARFLNTYSPAKSRVFSSRDPVAFVDELEQRLSEASAPVRLSSSATSIGSPASIPEGAIYVSFAPEDQTTATTLLQALAKRGLDVWPVEKETRQNLDPTSMERCISACSAFLPIISAHSFANADPYSRQEWSFAFRNKSRHFPVIVDDSPVEQLEKLDPAFSQSVTFQAVGGHPPDALVQELDKIQKLSRRQGCMA